tara:strand:- start:795 stop:2027 length:1233 start_codon:yes stop_codon:yes gene_type:complete
MDDNNYIYAQAKLEYTKQLIDILKNSIFDSFLEIHRESKKINHNTIEDIYVNFRSLLENIPKWNQTIIDSEVDKIYKDSSCDWIDDLLTAVYITHTKILLSVGKNNNNKKIDLVIPTTKNFIHKCFVTIARELWKNPYLYQDNIKASDYQRNIKSIEIIISEGIEQTIRNTLPLKDILKSHLDMNIDKINIDGDDSEEEEDIKNKSIREELLKEILTKSDEEYDDGPSEKEIIKNTTDIQVNDDLLKEDKEEFYDNVDIFEKETDKNYLEIMEQQEGQNQIVSENNYMTNDYNVSKKTNDVIVQEPVVQEPVVQEPVVQEPVVQEVIQEPVVQEVIQEPVVQEVIQEPVVQEVSDLSEEKDKIRDLFTSDKLIKIDKNKDETDTLDNFYEDLKGMSNSSNTNTNSYSLFN